MGVFSALCCLAVVAMIIGFKKYTFFGQRLILYLAIASFFQSLSYSFARVNYYTPRPLFDDYCYFGGFINLYTSWVEVLAIACLTANVFMNAVLDRWPAGWLQYLYLAIMYLGPLVICWIPFLEHAYGTAPGWCDLRAVDEHCNNFEFGFILRFTIWYAPVYVVLFLCFIATLWAAISSHRRTKIWYGIYNPHKKGSELRIKNEVKPLIWYPIIYSLLTVFSLANAIDIGISPKENTVVLWYLHVLTSPLRAAFIAVVYALDPETRSRLSPKKLYASCCSCRKQVVMEYDAIVNEDGDSLRSNTSSKHSNYGILN